MDVTVAALLSIITTTCAQILPQAFPRAPVLVGPRSPLLLPQAGRVVNPMPVANPLLPRPRAACTVSNFQMQPNFDLTSFMGQWYVC